MRRRTTQPRPGWRDTVERQGLLYSVTEDGIYWDESAHYEFSLSEVERLEDVVAELHALSLDTVAWVIAERRYADYGMTSPRVVAASRRPSTTRSPRSAIASASA